MIDHERQHPVMPEDGPLSCAQQCAECGHKIHAATPERYKRSRVCSGACWAELHGERDDDDVDEQEEEE